MAIPGLEPPNIRDAPLAAIWAESAAFIRFRGIGWQPEPCGSCPALQTDFGGCRGQDSSSSGTPRPPTRCASTHHGARRRRRHRGSDRDIPRPLIYRRFRPSTCSGLRAINGVVSRAQPRNVDMVPRVRPGPAEINVVTEDSQRRGRGAPIVVGLLVAGATQRRRIQAVEPGAPDRRPSTAGTAPGQRPKAHTGPDGSADNLGYDAR